MLIYFQFSDDIYGHYEEDAESGCPSTQDLVVRVDSDPQLPVKHLLNFHRMFRAGPTEKEPLVVDLDPVKEFYRKLELDKMYQEVTNKSIKISWKYLTQPFAYPPTQPHLTQLDRNLTKYHF